MDTMLDAADNAAGALKKLQQNHWNIMLVDIKMPGMDGIELLHVKEINKTHCGDHHNGVRVGRHCREGLSRMVPTTTSQSRSIRTTSITSSTRICRQQDAPERNLKLKEAVTELDQRGRDHRRFAGDQKVMELVRTVAPTDTTVMIRGKAAQARSSSPGQFTIAAPEVLSPSVTVNCGAMTETLLESELFGHEKGAFTGAQYRRKGKVELADGGTLFLDEIGNIDPKTQMDLLRVIETKQFTRVGGTEVLKSDFRVISVRRTRDLEKAVKDGTFREDLFYRVNVFPICLPPLRSRKGDVAKLAHYFLEKYTRAMNKVIEGFTRDAMLALKGYEWPGNVRELENAIERAVVVSSGPVIEKEHLPLQTLTPSTAIGRKLEDIEHKYIEEVLNETGWNISRAAAILDIDRVTLYHKIQKYGLKREP